MLRNSLSPTNQVMQGFPLGTLNVTHKLQESWGRLINCLSMVCTCSRAGWCWCLRAERCRSWVLQRPAGPGPAWRAGSTAWTSTALGEEGAQPGNGPPAQGTAEAGKIKLLLVSFG